MSLQQFTGCGRRGQRVSKIYSISDDDKYLKEKQTREEGQGMLGSRIGILNEGHQGRPPQTTEVRTNTHRGQGSKPCRNLVENNFLHKEQ